MTIIGAILYATICMWLDLLYATQNLSQFTASPVLEHWIAVKWLLRYITGMVDHPLTYGGSHGWHDQMIISYTDFDYVSNPNDHCSITGNFHLLGGVGILLVSKWQTIIATLMCTHHTMGNLLRLISKYGLNIWTSQKEILQISLL